MPINKKIKAFTIMELLVSMTLTGILVVFAFMGYNQIQKLFINYSTQSEFISEYNQLNKALFTISDRAQTIEKNNDNSIIFKSDSSFIILDINDSNVLLKFPNHTDTFQLPVKEKHFTFLPSNNSTSLPLLESFECNILFQSQQFRVSFNKQYDAETVLRSTFQLFPPDELY